MRGLLIRQPWAGLFASGLKVNAAGETLEFRNRETRIREQVAIQAASTLPTCGPKPTCPLAARCDGQSPPVLCARYPDLDCEQTGILCLATLTDCRPVETADVTCPGCPDPAGEEWMDTWAWVFTDLLALQQPVPCRPKRGAQTWFEVPPDVEAEVLRQAREGKGESHE